MLRRHIDFVAVSLIAFGLLALSQAKLVLPIGSNTIQVENIRSQFSECPASSRLAERLDQLFNH